MILVILGKAVLLIVLALWALFNVLSGRVPRERRLVHLAYVPVAWVCLFNVMTTSPILGFLVLLMCSCVILADYLHRRKANGR